MRHTVTRPAALSLSLLLCALFLAASTAQAQFASTTSTSSTSTSTTTTTTIPPSGELCPDGVGPCVVGQPVLLLDGTTVDLGIRGLVVQGQGSIDVGAGTVTIKAGDVVVSTGSNVAFKATASGQGGILILEARGACLSNGSACLSNNDCPLQQCQTTSGAIDLDGRVNAHGHYAGTVIIRAAGDVLLKGHFHMPGTSSNTDGGRLTVSSTFGAVDLSGSIDVSSGNDSSGGEVLISAGTNISIRGDIDASGGDWAGGLVALLATADIAVESDIDVSSKAGSGDGGRIELLAGGVARLGGGADGAILLQAKGNTDSDDFAGDGGELSIEAAAIVVEADATVRAKGGAPDGYGGDFQLTASGPVEIAGDLDVSGNGSASSGGDITITSGGSMELALTGLLDANGKGGGGMVSVVTGAADMVVNGLIDAGGGPDGSGGSVDIETGKVLLVAGTIDVSGTPSGTLNGTTTLSACRLDVASSGQILADGGNGGNELTASGVIRIAEGALVRAYGSGGTNDFSYRSSQFPPWVAGSVVPVATNTVSPFLTACVWCGDGQTEQGESCDDGNVSDADCCGSDCQPLAGTCDDGDPCTPVDQCIAAACVGSGIPCGNGQVEPSCGEFCDDGNTDDTDACLSDCTAASCGDGLLHAGIEACDDGNADDTDACLSDCTVADCGDGAVWAGIEECDDGGVSAACDADCTMAVCGDETVNPLAGEECDNGSANSDSQADACRLDCSQAGCGDGTVDGGEECDDGNADNGDQCRNDCILADCGDGSTAADEQCDDGNSTDGDGCSADCRLEVPQSRDQQKCINALNKAGVKVAKTQGKENAGCISGASKGTVADAASCTSADAGGKVARAMAKTVGKAASSCGQQPDFGWAGAVATNAAAQEEELGLIADIFGEDLNVAIIDRDADRVGAFCQAAVAKGYEKIVTAKLKVFGKCKKGRLKSGSAASGRLLASCFDEVAADDRGKIAKAVAKLDRKLSKKCGPHLVSAFPGQCAGASDTTLFASCVDRLVECRVCRMLNATDALTADCDLFDDSILNSTCDE